MRPLLNYYGSKWNAAPWIIEQFPDHEIYCEPFGGGAGVLLRKPRSKREIYNDIDDELYNLFVCVRDHGPKLKRLIELTPHSRREFINAYRKTKRPLERARRTLVKAFFGIGDSIKENRGTGMRTSNASNTAVEKSWVSYAEQFEEIIERLKGLVLECLDYREVIEKYDSPTTLFYLDPPYVKQTRSERHAYRHDFTDADHIELLKVVSRVKGMCIVSGYDNELYATIGWRKIEKEFMSQGATRRTETLWICPKTIQNSKQMEMAI